MPGFGHGEAARQFHRHRCTQVALVMSLRAQPADDAAEEPVLHADLDQQREVDQRDGLEGGQRRAHVPLPAVLAWEEQPCAARRSGDASIWARTSSRIPAQRPSSKLRSSPISTATCTIYYTIEPT